MRIVTNLLFVAILALPNLTFAQSSEVDLLRKIFSAEKKALTEEFLQLSGSDANAFWDLYNAYETERTDLVDRRLGLIEDYADQYENLTNEQATALANRAFKIRSERLKLQQKYFKKISKAVDAKTAASFFQLESYIQAAVDFELYDAIPFVGE